MVLHADAVAQNRPSSVGACRIDRDDAHGAVFVAIAASKLVYQRALARARGASESDDPRLPAVRKESLEQIGPARRAVLDRADGTGQGARIAGAKLLDQGMEALIQTVSV